MPEKNRGIEDLRFVPGDLYRGFRHQAAHDRASLAAETGIVGLGTAGLAMMGHAVNWSEQYAQSDKSGAVTLTIIALGMATAQIGAIESLRRSGEQVRLQREQESIIRTFE